MLTDITLKVTPKMVTDAQGNESKALVGHIGTHFDVMNKEFPLEYTRRNGIVFDVSSVCDRDIELEDVDLSLVEPDMFAAFYTGFVGESLLLGWILRESGEGVNIRRRISIAQTEGPSSLKISVT